MARSSVNKKDYVLVLECYFRYNNPSISLQKGQTFLPTAKLVDYILRSQPFFMKEYFMGGNIMYDVVIVGAGPGGIFTAYELLEKRPDLSIAVFEMGNELTKRHCPIDGDKVIETEALIISTGATAKYLGLEDEKKYAGMGVSACATCDGFFYRKKVVAVVGGGDTACEEAIYLAGLASKVYLVVRKPYLRASKIMQERVMKHDKIEVLFEHNVVGLFGDNGVEGMNLVKRWEEPDEERYSLPIDGFFLAIGHKPNSDIFKPYLDTDEVGYIITDGDSPRTKVPGVFAAGDVADSHYRQAITAAGSGCKAAIEAERYLSEKGLI